MADAIRETADLDRRIAGRSSSRYVKSWLRKRRAKIADALLQGAMDQPRRLRTLADALEAAPTEDPQQKHILGAWEDCVKGRYAPMAEVGECYLQGDLPTLSQLRGAFVARFGEQCWPADFTVRKTLRVLGLPLKRAKLGAPAHSPPENQGRKPRRGIITYYSQPKKP